MAPERHRRQGDFYTYPRRLPVNYIDDPSSWTPLVLSAS